MPPSLKDFALQMLRSNPNFENNPMAQNAIQAIENGDNKTGEEIANNLLDSYGMTKEEGIAQATQWAKNFPMFR